MLMGNGQSRLLGIHDLPLIKSFNPAHRGSISASEHPQSPAFLSAPHVGQNPLQSSRQSVRVGTSNKTCSLTISSTSIDCPSKTDTDINSSVNSAVRVDSYSLPVMYSSEKSLLTGS